MFTLGGMNGLRVAELAARAGVAASTVRFYERAGLLSPARRAQNGYRMFDESALEELAFIQRAKATGNEPGRHRRPGGGVAQWQLSIVAGPDALTGQ